MSIASAALLAALSQTMDSRLSLIRAIHFREFLSVSLTLRGPGGLVNIVIIIQRNRSINCMVDLIDSKDGSAAVVNGRDVSVGAIGLVRTILIVFRSSGPELINC